jgi:plasmid maintenance system killer protein
LTLIVFNVRRADVDIVFKNKKLQKICNSEREMNREFGKDRASRIGRRLDDIRAASTLEILRPPFPGRCHELKGDRKGQLSLDLDHPYRLIFEPHGEAIKHKEDRRLDWASVTGVRIIGVEDTHD